MAAPWNIEFDGRVGTVTFNHDEPYDPIRVTLWHPANEAPCSSWHVDRGCIQLLSSENGEPGYFGNNFGVQLGGGPIKPLGVVANYDRGCWSLSTTQFVNTPFFQETISQ